MSYPVRRERGTIFIALPPSAWRPCGGCACPECKAGAAQVWDTLALPEKPDRSRYRDDAYTCHYPELSQPRPYDREMLPNSGGPA